MIQTDLSVLTTLLCGTKERKSPPQRSGQEKRLNPYLVYRVALPILADQTIYVEDICYEEFELEDLWPVAEFFLNNWPDSYYSCVLADGAVSLPAQAQKTKQFC